LNSTAIHRHVLDREAAAKGGFICGKLIGDVALHDKNGGPAFARGGELRLIADEDEAVWTGIARHVALGGGRIQVAVQVREDVARAAWTVRALSMGIPSCN
jgi:hypothetical protein